MVLDADGSLHGWVSGAGLAAGTSGPGEAGGEVRDHARRMDAWLPLGAPLKQAFSTMLQHDAGWIAVLDGERFLGVLTPAALHAALRRSTAADAGHVQREDVVVESVPSA